jgi:hypothetical protein
MLKITNNKNGGVRAFKLEGKLAGEWVNELRSCWQQAMRAGEGEAIIIDLAAVTWVSDEGKALLSEMYRNGAELLAANLMMAGIVAEISADAS